MAWQYFFAPFGVMIYILYIIALILLPFALLYSFIGPVGIGILILIVIIAGIHAALEISERVSETELKYVMLSFLFIFVLIIAGIVGYALLAPSPSIGDTQTIGGLEVTVEDTYITESVQTIDGEIRPTDLSKETLPDSADRFLVVILTVEEVEGSFYNRVDEVTLRHQESNHIIQPVDLGLITYDGEVIDQFEGSDEIQGYPEYQAVIFPVKSVDPSEYRIQLRVTDDDGETETWRLIESDG